MTLPATFTNTGNEYWHIAITYGDILRVREHVSGIDGRPLDLCRIAETGDFRQVADHIHIIVKCVYWLLYPQLKESYGMDGLELQEWFYAHIDGDTIVAMTKAWYEALVNFTPYPVVKAAMLTAGETITKSEIITAIEMLAGQLEACMNTEESSELTQEDSLMANSSRWLNPI